MKRPRRNRYFRPRSKQGYSEPLIQVGHDPAQLREAEELDPKLREIAAEFAQTCQAMAVNCSNDTDLSWLESHVMMSFWQVVDLVKEKSK